MSEIIYQPTGNSERGKIHSYHSKPSPRVLSVGAHKKDVEKLKCVKPFGSDVYKSTYCIGMEVEKTSLHRGAVKEYALFCGFETDRSCGYEAVTNILPLLPRSYWRNKVFNMMHEANKIIDDQFSPSDASCGGHMSVSVDGLTGYQLKDKARGLMGLIYALYPKRLNNGYCNGDLRMTDTDIINGAGWHGSGRYSTINARYDYMEIRIPTRFTSVRQMMRRYELMYELVDSAVKGTKFKTFLKKVEPILMMQYDHDVAKVQRVLELAVHFQDYINTGKVHESIVLYVPRERNP
jgi:hypothetical protein